jgi:hypothetical protein
VLVSLSSETNPLVRTTHNKNKYRGRLIPQRRSERRIKPDSKSKGEKSQAEHKPWESKDFRPVCKTEQRVLRQSQGLSENKPVTVANKFSLEEFQRHLQECADKETDLSGAEQSLITDITAEVGVLTNRPRLILMSRKRKAGEWFRAMPLVPLRRTADAWELTSPARDRSSRPYAQPGKKASLAFAINSCSQQFLGSPGEIGS